jgi:hypothetical protein
VSMPVACRRMSTLGTVEIQRQRRYTGFAQTYKVLVDGQEIGTIKNGTTTSFDVAPGHHEIQLKIEITQSPPLEIDVPAGGTVPLTCGPRANPFTALLYTLFRPKRFLRLDPA